MEVINYSKYKNGLKNQLKKMPEGLWVTLEIILTLIIIGAVVNYLLIPNYLNWTKGNEELHNQKTVLENLKGEINSLRSIDPVYLDEAQVLLNSIVPNDLDMFHFATLNDAVAQSIGANVTSLQINQLSTSEIGLYTVKATYVSNFQKLLELLTAWTQADQMLNPVDLLARPGLDGNIIYTISYELTGKLMESGGYVTLTEADRQKIAALKSSIRHTATPSAYPLGKENPFVR